MNKNAPEVLQIPNEVYDSDGDGEVGEESVSPSTGDSLATPVMTIVLAVVASAVLMLIRKRKEGAENA